MQDPKIAELRARVKGKKPQQELVVPRHVSTPDIDRSRIVKLRLLRKKELHPAEHPLLEKVRELTQQLATRPTSAIAEDEAPKLTQIVVHLEKQFRKLLRRNQEAREADAARLADYASSVLQLDSKAAELDAKLAEADEIKLAATRTLRGAERYQATLKLERDELETDKRSWLAKLPSLQRKISRKEAEYDQLIADQINFTSKLAQLRGLIRDTLIELQVVKADRDAAIQKRIKLKVLRARAAEYRAELRQLEEDKMIKSTELSAAITAKQSAESAISGLEAQKLRKASELAGLDRSITSAKTVLVGIQDETSAILSDTEDLLTEGIKRRSEIDAEAAGILPRLRARVVRIKVLQADLNREIKAAQKKQKDADNAKANFEAAAIREKQSAREHKEAAADLRSKTSQITKLIAEAKTVIANFSLGIKLIGTNFAGIAQAWERVEQQRLYNKEVKLSNAKERAVVQKWRKDLKLWEASLQDREKTLIANIKANDKGKL